MRVSLDKENRFLTSDGRIDLKRAFMYAGVKAAWCYKPGSATPESIRETSEETLLRMGTDTWISDHGTPDEHQEVSVEITGLPKILCMILNDEHQYTTCERSLRYTKIKDSPMISDLEISLYNKWYDKFYCIFESKYWNFFLASAKGDTQEEKEKNARKDMGKLAQENARQFVSVLVPTSISYTAPWYQWQKIANFLLDMVETPPNELAKIASPYALDLVSQLVELGVVVTTKEATKVYPLLIEKIKDGRRLLYKNNKDVKLSLFAENNEFSGLDKPNEFGATINYNSELTFSAFAQGHRHRTAYWELKEPDTFKTVVPPVIKEAGLANEYIQDMMLVSKLHPQGQIIKANTIVPLKNAVKFIGQERACDRAQWEIEDWYVNRFMPDVVEGLEKRPEYQEEAKKLKLEYLGKCRCQYPNYKCPNPCGHPRPKRPF